MNKVYIIFAVLVVAVIAVWIGGLSGGDVNSRPNFRCNIIDVPDEVKYFNCYMGEDPVMDGVTIVLGENITDIEVKDEGTGKMLMKGEYRLFTESI